MNSRQAIKYFRRRVPGVSEEVKELLSTDGLVWLFLGHCRGAVQTPPPLQTPRSLFLPGITPPWTVLQPAPHLTTRMEWPIPLTLSRPDHQNCLQDPSLGITLPRAGS